MSFWKKLTAGISSATARDVVLDSSTHCLNVIDYSHHQIHEGNHFYAAHTFTGRASGTAGQIDLLIVTQDNANWHHMFFNFSANRRFDVFINETGTVAATGTNDLDTWNSNRNRSSGTNLRIWFTGVNATAGAGRYIFFQDAGASGRGPVPGIGGAIRNDYEIVLQQNSNYLVRLTPHEPSCTMNIYWHWYEHNDRD